MYTFKEIDEDEYEIEYEGFSKDYRSSWKYKRKNPINEDQKNNRNEFAYKDNVFVDGDSIYFGEVIGSIIAQKTIENGCDAELAIRDRHYRGCKNRGVISYYYYAKGDKVIGTYYLIQQYCLHENIPRRGLPKIDDFIGAFRVLCANYQRPYSEFEALRQQYIDMIVFDCRYGNLDRSRENWHLYEDGKTGEIKLYPLFDNEGVLGFDEFVANGEDAKQIIEYCRDSRMAHIVPGDGTREFSRMEDILKYLLAIYPEETKRSLEKVNRFSLEDLSNLLDEFPDLSDMRKGFAKQMYIARGLLFERYIAEAEKSKSPEKTKSKED